MDARKEEQLDHWTSISGLRTEETWLLPSQSPSNVNLLLLSNWTSCVWSLLCGSTETGLRGLRFLSLLRESCLDITKTFSLSKSFVSSSCLLWHKPLRIRASDICLTFWSFVVKERERLLYHRDRQKGEVTREAPKALSKSSFQREIERERGYIDFSTSISCVEPFRDLSSSHFSTG